MTTPHISEINAVTSNASGAQSASAIGRIGTPVFMVGAERSGTTLLRLMLDHHPRINFHHEFEFVVDWMGDDGTLPPVDEFLRQLRTDSVFQRDHYVVDPSLDYPSLIKSFLAQKVLQTAQPPAAAGATVHRHFDRLLHIWPDAKFIHLIRDPRDVARSVIQMGWAGNTWVASERWLEAEACWDRLKQHLSPDRYVELSYETLLADPVGELTRICEFMSVEYDAAMLSYPEHSTYGQPDPALAYQWRRKATKLDVQYVESRLDDLLKDRGYEFSEHERISLNDADVRRLHRQSKQHCRAVRRQRHGWPLYFAEIVTRRLGLKPLHNRVFDRMQIKAQRYIK